MRIILVILTVACTGISQQIAPDQLFGVWRLAMECGGWSGCGDPGVDRYVITVERDAASGGARVTATSRDSLVDSRTSTLDSLFFCVTHMSCLEIWCGALCCVTDTSYGFESFAIDSPRYTFTKVSTQIKPVFRSQQTHPALASNAHVFDLRGRHMTATLANSSTRLRVTISKDGKRHIGRQRGDTR